MPITDLESVDYKRNKKARYLISQLLMFGEDRFKRHKIVVQVTKDLKYVYIPMYPLPHIWRQRNVPLLIHIPESYPDIPPIGFYIPHGTCLRNGQRHGHQCCRSFYSEPNLHDIGWDWFCIHLTDKTDWQVKNDPLQPHNFWTYMEVVRLALSNLEVKDNLQ